ncbi:MAG: hypothetical protein AAF517_23585, partial [Planctomycetota bacterium]
MSKLQKTIGRGLLAILALGAAAIAGGLLTLQQSQTDERATRKERAVQARAELAIHDGKIHGAAIDWLESRGRTVLGTLEEFDTAVQKTHIAIRHRAVKLLSRFGPEAVPVLESYVFSQPLPFATVALEVLAKMEGGLDVIARALLDERQLIRLAAAKTLGSVTDHAKEAAPLLISALRFLPPGDAGSKDRDATQQALLKLGEGAVPALLAAVSDPACTPEIHYMMLGVLRQLGEKALSAAPKLADVLRTELEAFQSQEQNLPYAIANLISCLGAIGGTQSDEALAHAVEHMNDEVLRVALFALNRRHSVPKLLEAPVRVALESRGSVSDDAAASVLSRLDGEPETETIETIFDKFVLRSPDGVLESWLESDPTTRTGSRSRPSIRARSRVSSSRTRRSSPDVSMRLAAILVGLGPTAANVFCRVAKNDRGKRRELAVALLVEMAKGARGSTDQLRTLATSLPNFTLRLWATIAFARATRDRAQAANALVERYREEYEPWRAQLEGQKYRPDILLKLITTELARCGDEAHSVLLSLLRDPERQMVLLGLRALRNSAEKKGSRVSIPDSAVPFIAAPLGDPTDDLRRCIAPEHYPSIFAVSSATSE